MELGQQVSLQTFMAALRGRALVVPREVYGRLAAARQVVDAAALGEAPVYGLNTGLGANLGHRIAPQDIPAFQHQLIAGRAVALGPLLPPQTGRAVLLARLIGIAHGHAGMSVAIFDHLCALYRAGLAPGVPQYGSIGAADLTQNATWAMAVLGEGRIWDGRKWHEGAAVLDAAGLTPPPLQPKDAMALINHSGTTVALAAEALLAARQGFSICCHAAVMSFEGYGANADIFAPEINVLRSSPGQAEMAAWFRDHITPPKTPCRVQDPLSFRTVAPVMGTARAALDHAVAVWEAEANGAGDSPAVMAGDAMRSTPNFHTPALALALEQVSLALVMVASGIVMRVQRLMDPDLTGLPRYLSPVGGASAGFVPLQKTAAALLADVRRHAMPVIFDPAPVSDGVEDVAPMTPQAARKLSEQMVPFHLLVGVEAVVAAQARDLRRCAASPLHSAIRKQVPMLGADRSLGGDVEAAVETLKAYPNDDSAETGPI